MDLGRIGIWSMVGGDEAAVSEAAAALEEAGYGALWIPGGAGGDVLERCATALARDDHPVLGDRNPEHLATRAGSSR